MKKLNKCSDSCWRRPFNHMTSCTYTTYFTAISFYSYYRCSTFEIRIIWICSLFLAHFFFLAPVSFSIFHRNQMVFGHYTAIFKSQRAIVRISLSFLYFFFFNRAPLFICSYSWHVLICMLRLWFLSSFIFIWISLVIMIICRNLDPENR